MKTTEDRFWEKVNVPTFTEDCCWLWTAAEFPRGYGAFWFDNKLGRATRYIYEVMVGPIPEGHHLDHRTTCPKQAEPVAIALRNSLFTHNDVDRSVA